MKRTKCPNYSQDDLNHDYYLFNLGALLSLMKSNPSVCDLATGLEPTFAMPLFWSAAASHSLEDYPCVVSSTAILLRRFPAHRGSRSLRCDALRRLGRWPDVLREATFLCQGDSKDGPAWTAKAEAQMHLREFVGAEASATRAIEVDGKDRLAFQVRGESRYQQGKYKKSIGDFHRFQILERERSGSALTMPVFSIWNHNRDCPL